MKIATQNYSVNPPFLNVSSVPSPFNTDVPEWALRVNGLWFASLIISLATASIGMLVQSWLREYLAGEWISPQEKLRARQYRHPAMDHWRVFQIAAALPLLLQVALGLFFIGLCFFTQAIDPRMGHTSLPLVVAWAFFFLITAVAPLISPRCPFKILILKRIMKLGRQYLMPFIFAFLRGARRRIILVVKAVVRQSYEDPPPPPTPRDILISQRLQLLSKSNTTDTTHALRLVAHALDTVRDLTGNPIDLKQFILPGVRISLDAWLLTVRAVKEIMIKGYVGDEEEDFVTQAQDDVETLLATDRIMANDGLLSTMRDAVKQSGASPETIMRFIIGLIQHRVVSISEPSRELDLRRLSKTAHDTLTSFVVDTLKSWDVTKVAESKWLHYACAILAAVTSYPISGLMDEELLKKVCEAIGVSHPHPEPRIAITFVLRVFDQHPEANPLPQSLQESLIISATQALKAKDDWETEYVSAEWKQTFGHLVVAVWKFPNGPVEPALFGEDLLPVVCKIIGISELEPENVVGFVEAYLRRCTDNKQTTVISTLENVPLHVYRAMIELLVQTSRHARPVANGISELWVKQGAMLLASTPPPSLPSDFFQEELIISVCNIVSLADLDPDITTRFARRVVPLLSTDPGQPSFSENAYVSIMSVLLATIVNAGSLAPEIAQSCVDYTVQIFLAPRQSPVIPPLRLDRLLQAGGLCTAQTYLGPGRALQVVLRILQHYSGSSKTPTPIYRPIAIHGLQHTLALSDVVTDKTSYEHLMNAVGAVLQGSIKDGRARGSLTWMHDSVFILMSESLHPLPRGAHDALYSVVTDPHSFFWNGQSVVATIERHLYATGRFYPLARRLIPIYNAPGRPELRPILRMYNRFLGATLNIKQSAPLWLVVSALLQHRSSSEVSTLGERTLSVLSDLWHFLEQTLPAEAGRSAPNEERLGVMEGLFVLVRLRGELGQSIEAAQILRKFWETWSESYRTMGLFTAIDSNARVSDEDAIESTADAFLGATPECMYALSAYFC